MKKFWLVILLVAISVSAHAEEQLATQEGRIVKMHLETLLEKIPGIRVLPAGNAVIIDGDIEDPAHMRRIYVAMTAVNEAGGPIHVTTMAKLTPAGAAKIVDNMTALLGNSDIKVSVAENHLVLEGIAKSDFEADRAVEFAKLEGVETVIDLLRITPKRGTASAPKRKNGPVTKKQDKDEE